MSRSRRACKAGNYTCGGIIHNDHDTYCDEHKRRQQNTQNRHSRRSRRTIDPVTTLLQELQANA